MNLNRAQIIGNLTRDPESRTTPNGQTVCSFSVATSSKWKDKTSGENREQTEFHNVVAWGKLAEICQQYLGKGRKVFVEGRLATRQWEGQDGAKKQRTEIVAENMILLDRAPAGTKTAQASQGPSPETGEQPAPAPAEEEIRIEDVPF